MQLAVLLLARELLPIPRTWRAVASHLERIDCLAITGRAETYRETSIGRELAKRLELDGVAPSPAPVRKRHPAHAGAPTTTGMETYAERRRRSA